MRKIIPGILIFLFVFTSCEKEEFTTCEFFIDNDCDFTINVHSSAIVRYSSGSKEENLHDVLSSNEKISMRRIKVSENFKMRSVFSKLEIFKGSTKSTYDIMNKENWQKKIISDDKVEYTLIVDSTFF